MTREEYVDAAVYYVNNKVKNVELRQELLCHIDDGTAYHTAHGMPYEQALEKTLGEMGSPYVLAKKLMDVYPESVLDTILNILPSIAQILIFPLVIFLLVTSTELGAGCCVCEILCIGVGSALMYLTARRGMFLSCLLSAGLSFFWVVRTRSTSLFVFCSLLRGMLPDLPLIASIKGVRITDKAYIALDLIFGLLYVLSAVVTLVTLHELGEPWRKRKKTANRNRYARIAVLAMGVIAVVIDASALPAVMNPVSAAQAHTYEGYYIMEFDEPVPVSQIDLSAALDSHFIEFWESGMIYTGGDAYFSGGETVARLEGVPVNDSVSVNAIAGEIEMFPSSAYIALIPYGDDEIYPNEIRWYEARPGEKLLVPNTSDPVCLQYAEITIGSASP